MRKCVEIAQSVLHIKVRHTMRIDRIAQRNIRVNLHPFLGVEAHLFVGGPAFAQVVRPLHRLHKGWELDDLATQRTVEDPSCPYRNLRWTSLGTAQHNLHANISGADASNGGNIVEEDHSSDQQTNHSRANLNELHRESPCIMIPASAGIQYFTKDRHYILQIFLNATKPPAAVASNRHTPPRTARSLGKLS